MGYFNGLVDGILKKDEQGRSVVYPLGILGRGHVLPDEQAEQRVRQFLVRYYKITFALIFICALFLGWALTFGLALPLAAWGYIVTKRLVAAYPVSDVRLRLRESYANSAATYSAFTVWSLLTISLLFVVGGVFMVVSAETTKQWLTGLASILFFGAGVVAFAYMAWVRRR